MATALLTTISEEESMQTMKPFLASIVGMDGCGKSSTFRMSLWELAERIRVVGIGDQVLSGGPDEPIRERADVPFSRSARFIGRLAKGTRWQSLYKNLKFIEFTERTRVGEYVTTHDFPDVILTDGHPLVNCAAWAAARFYKDELSGDDEMLFDAVRYMSGEQTIPIRELPRYLRRAWQLALLNLLRLGRFGYPDLVFLLDIDPALAMDRIRARGRPLQVHETERVLGDLGRAYIRVCDLLQQRRSIPVTRIQVDQVSQEETAQRVVDAVLEQVLSRRNIETADQSQPGRIEIVATTISGSIKDQRKVNEIGPEFRSRTSRPVRVHTADSHAEARALAHDVVAGGGRTIVSAGGAGTFNAVLEGAHMDGGVPSDLHIAFLRKGSADLIGKALGISDQLPAAVSAIVEGIENDRCITADILAVEATELDGRVQRRHMVGFAGLGVFGEVPRFTETRLIKVYKGVLGTLLGDLGPFFVGLALSTVWWQLQRLLGRVPPMSLTLDGQEIPPDTWGAVLVLNGDLGADFPLGRGLSLGSGTFRVIVLRYRGMRQVVGQIRACRRGKILDDPERYGATVTTVRTLTVRPVKRRPYMVNVDGLRMITRGEVRVSVSGQVKLIAG